LYYNTAMKIPFAERLATKRVSFRTALSTLLMVMIFGTVALLGGLSYYNLKRNADTLSGQVLDESSLRIRHWVGTLLSRAQDQGEMNRQLLGSVELRPETLNWLTRHLQRVLETQSHFTFLSAGFESGLMLSVERLQDGGFSIREARYDLQSGKAEILDFRPEDYPQRKAYERREVQLTGERRLPGWYTAARDAGGPIWTEGRTLRSGTEAVPGVTYATPIYNKDQQFIGVTTVDFDISAISRFLNSNPIGKTGFAFIIEKTAGGKYQVLAHPEPEKLTREFKDDRGRSQFEFTEWQKLSDERVVRFMEAFSQDSGEYLGHDLRTFRFSAGGADYFGSYRRMAGRDLPGWIIALVIPYHEIMGAVDRNNLETLLIGIAAFFLILISSAWISALVSKPLRRIALDSEAIGRFEIEARPIERSQIREVDQLMVATHDMKRGLRSFGKYVPADLVREILASGGEAELGGQRASLTIFFTDIADFTTISERLEPEALVDQLGEYFEAMSSALRQQPPGTLDKFIGDSIMAFWGAPLPNPDHAVTACRAALLCQERLKVLQEKWSREGKPLFYQRIGINTGEVIVGNMGSASRLNYTVVGDTVNTASRFEGLNKLYGTRIIVGQSTWELVKEKFVARPLDLVSVKGSAKGVRIYELLAETASADERTRAIAALAETALTLYLERRWDEAGECCRKILELNHGDEPARILMERCRIMLENPPPGDWNGVHRIESK
jgi:adenylate cyclase